MKTLTENPREIMKKYSEKMFDFAIAIKLLKAGYRVYRKGWNGTGMYVTFQKGYPDGIPINKNTAEATGIEEGTVCIFHAYLMLKTAAVTAEFVPWTPSGSDVLAEDWMIAW